MADDPSKGGSPKTEPTRVEISEDAETRAARRELKQSTLSDAAPTAGEVASDAEQDKSGDLPDTPPLDIDLQEQQEQMKEDVLSPKKKRPHDQLDKDRLVDDNDATSTTSTDSAKDRASRLEPEKKRHRDEETTADDSHKASTAGTTEATSDQTSKTSETTKAQASSTSAFATSGFGKLAAGASPFASLGGPKSTGFGSVKSPPPAQSSGPPKLTFGSGGGASPFAGLGQAKSNGFGSAFGGGSSGFGSALGGGALKPLPSFAALGSQPLKSEKPAKPFGAPDSDVENEDEEDDNEDDEGGDDASQPDVERLTSPEKEPEEKKKMKLQKVEVNDGEAGEATIVSVRAKVFHHDKEAGWKERGAGMLKINVPEACVDFDGMGVPVPGSFDASALDGDDDESGSGPKVARLLLRQDQTHRVILNTAIVPAMKFQEKESLKSVGIVFTAFEGADAKPINITAKMTAANAKAFMKEIGIVQRELRDR